MKYIFFLALMASCTNSYHGQICDSKTMACGKMEYGPFNNLSECVARMKQMSIEIYNCGKNCKEEHCEETVRFPEQLKDMP